MIRFATLKDLDEIIILCGLHAAYEKVFYEPKGKKEKLKHAFFSNEPSQYCLVAEIQNEVIGYATFAKQYATWDAFHYIYMDCLFLKEVARGQNIGEKMMNRIVEEAKILNCSLVQWQTPAFNKGAIKFYHRIGGTALSKQRFFLSV